MGQGRLASMKSILFLVLACLVFPMAGVLNGWSATSDTAHPNFLFLLVDDLGWADTGPYGSRYHLTPNIDRLAAGGARFTQGYAACPVCSPTRASIMTGRHPVRVDITDWIPGARANARSNPRFQHVDDRDHLALEEVTIAEVLKVEGYQTFFAGKWHLGSDGALPTDQGFDINIGGFSKGSPPGGYYAPWTNPYLKANQDGEYLTERLTQETISFINKRNPGQPFFAFLSYYNVHTPIQPYKKEHRKYIDRKREFYGDSKVETIPEHEGQSRARQDNPEYASMVAAVDVSVGDLLDSLESLGLDDNTVIFFFSDNGGLCTTGRGGPTSNLPLRSGKGWLYEGGIREPMLIRAPGVTSPGSVIDEAVISTDFFPTILELAGLDLRPDLHADGVSLIPLLSGADSLPSRDLFWHYPHYHGSTWKPGAAIRSGDWKLIEFYEYGKSELYNLASDPGESTDLIQTFPGIANDLKVRLASWQKSMNARMPVPVEASPEGE